MYIQAKSLIKNLEISSHPNAIDLGDITAQRSYLWYLNILHDSGHDLSSNKVRIGIGTRSAVLEVTTALILSVPSNSNRSSTVGNTECEFINGGSLELSTQTKFVTLSINGDVFLVLGTKLVNSLLNDIQTTGLTHGLGRDVGVHTGTVPVTLNNWLGVQGAVYLELLADTLQDVTRHEKLITSIDSDAGSYLVFLLSRHDLSVGSADLDSGVKTGTVDGIGNGTSKGVLGTGSAVVWALGAVGHTVLGPAKRSTLIKVEKSEFLLEAEPDFLVILTLEGSSGCIKERAKDFVSKSDIIDG